MKNIKRTSDIVKRVLEEVPATRNSNDLLYVNVCNRINPAVCTYQFNLVLLHRKDFNIPPYESVMRARRKICNQFPELRGTEDIEAYRKLNEEIVKDYARRG